MKKIGLIFGSFNPLHNGHLRLATAAQADLGLDDVWFIVQNKNNYKPVFDFIDYSARKQLITESGLMFYEPHSTDYDHLIRDTLKQIKGYDLTLILGEDLIASFPQWTDYDEIRGLASVYESRRIDGISSGQVRDRVEAGKAIDHLVPPAVASYLAPRLG